MVLCDPALIYRRLISIPLTTVI